MPGYPTLIAAVQAVFGRGLLPVRVADAVLGTAAIGLVWLLARELYGAREAVVAAAITAVYPFFVAQAALVLSETLFVVWMLAAGICLARAWRRCSPRWAALAGLWCGLATLTRGSFLPVGPLAAVGWAAFGRPRRRALGCAGAMLGALAIALAPWVIRNWGASDGHLVLTTLRMGPSLYEGLNPEADGGPMMERINWDEGTRGLSERERDRYWRRRAVEYALANPGRVAALAWRKLGRFWNVVPNFAALRSPLLCLALGVPYVVVMLLAAVGLAWSWRRGDVALIVLLPVVYYCGVHMIFVGSVRYREAVMPLLIVLAARGAARVWRGGWRKAANGSEA